MRKLVFKSVLKCKQNGVELTFVSNELAIPLLKNPTAFDYVSPKYTTCSNCVKLQLTCKNLPQCCLNLQLNDKN